MSNPAVIILANADLSIGNLRIEDNIGESIHVHLGDFRFDFTIEEFFNLSSLIETAIRNLSQNGPLNLDHFDKLFLGDIASYISDINDIQYLDCNLDELKVFSGKSINRKLVSLAESDVLKYFNDDTKSYIDREQENIPLVSNIQRINSFTEFMSNKSYPDEQGYIVLFNNQKIIRDGQHRAALLRKNNIHIAKVMNISFKKNKYSINSSLILIIYYLRKPIGIFLNFYKFSRSKTGSILRKYGLRN